SGSSQLTRPKPWIKNVATALPTGPTQSGPVSEGSCGSKRAEASAKQRKALAANNNSAAASRPLRNPVVRAGACRLAPEAPSTAALRGRNGRVPISYLCLHNPTPNRGQVSTSRSSGPEGAEQGQESQGFFHGCGALARYGDLGFEALEPKGRYDCNIPT